ncbi:MAG: M81 family metallopeptidase [Betaproteobacteria bacterium]
MAIRVAVARLWHEGNSFTPVRTRLADFRQKEWAQGAEAIGFYRGSRTELGAAVDFFEEKRALTPIFLRCAAAGPGGPVDEEDLQRIVGEILEGVLTANADALYLSLHGALIGTESLRADLALLRGAREILGRKRLAVSFDLHANLDPEIASLVDVLVGYKTYPHVDMHETGRKALELLMREEEKAVAIAKVGKVLPSFRMRTSDGPMAEIEALAARRAAETPGIFDITPFGGFAYGDSPCAGASVAVTANERSLAQALADELAGEMLRRAPQFAVHLVKPEQAFNHLAKRRARAGIPAAILEPSDNPLSGGVADTTGLLRALLEHGAKYRAVFAFFCDPEIVAQAHERESLTVGVGGKYWGPPVPLETKVERVTDGRFRNAGPMEKGLEVNLGRTVVLRAGNARIIVTESCQAPNDMEYFRLHGIDLAEVDLVCAKAKNHFRAAFGALFDPIIEVDTPGPAAADLAAMPFRHVSPIMRQL